MDSTATVTETNADVTCQHKRDYVCGLQQGREKYTAISKVQKRGMPVEKRKGKKGLKTHKPQKQN